MNPQEQVRAELEQFTMFRKHFPECTERQLSDVCDLIAKHHKPVTLLTLRQAYNALGDA